MKAIFLQLNHGLGTKSLVSSSGSRSRFEQVNFTQLKFFFFTYKIEIISTHL